MEKSATAKPDSTDPGGEVELPHQLLTTPPADDGTGDTEPGLLSFFAAWSERRYATKCCRELMQLHEAVSARHPGAAGLELYKLIVLARLGGDAALAQQVLGRAAESYALWPVPRALTFRDVVHYLTVSGYLDVNHGRRWICSDVRRFIDSAIPKHL
ncbi:MAG: hypothetical protein OEU94_00545 [Aquincola sp.]|nr:hypothetical protein [Aquincola sp.]MDH4288057.1 hypothetical protein [Aquincola sp.]MDH5328892.1 hypothetical protein [Aquincola sp.]